MTDNLSHIVWFENLRRDDVPRVGGKNASLGEMVATLTAQGIKVPPGFAITADAYWRFIDTNGLRETIASLLAEFTEHKLSLADAAAAIRRAILRGEWTAEMAQSIGDAYEALSRRAEQDNLDVAVRSSATAEDLPDASFAGQQETYLNIRGARAAGRVPALLCIALHRPRNQLPGG